MRPSLSPALLLLFVAGLAPDTVRAQGGDGSWSADFAQAGLLGRVFSVGRHGGHLVAGGQVFETPGRRIEHVARFDGQEWLPYGEGVTGIVRAIIEFQGELVVAGEFSHANGPDSGGLTEVNSIARWDGQRWQPLGNGLDLSWGLSGTVFDLEIFQGDLYAAGEFDTVAGQTVEGIARWDGSQWHDVGGLQKGSYPKGLSLTVTQDDRLVVGGEFTSAGGVAAMNVAAWDGASWTPLGAGLGSEFSSVFALAEYQGTIHAGGNFRSSGQNSSIEKVASFDGVAWNPLGGGVPDWTISTTVYCLEELHGDLYVGGNFTQAGGVSSRCVAGWNGAQWFSVGGVEGSDLATTAIAMTVWDDRLVVGGEFVWGGQDLTPGGPVVSTMVIGFDGSQWSQIGAGGGADGAVEDLTEWNGGLVAVGTFRTLGDELATRVAYHDGSRWTSLGHFTNGNVYDAFEWQGDLIVTGNFLTVNGRSIRYIARYDGVQWHSMGDASGGDVHVVYQGDLYAGYYDLYRWNGSSWDVVADLSGGGIGVQSLVVHDGLLYVGGNFTNVGPHVAAWDGTSLTGVGGDLPHPVRSMTAFGDELVVGLDADWQAGSAPIVRSFDGSNWSVLDPSFNGSVVRALTEFQGDLYASGDLIHFGHTDPRKRIARWDGSAWHALDEGIDAYVHVFLPDEAAGVLRMGGSMNEAGGLPSHSLAEWHPARDLPTRTSCFGDGTGTPCPCGNDATTPGQGCVHSGGVGMTLSSAGTESVAADDLVIVASNCPPGNAGIFYAGKTALGPGTALFDGLQCAGGDVRRFQGRFQSSGTVSDTGFAGQDPSGTYFAAGETLHFQYWSRDAAAGATPCGTFANFSPLYTVTLSP